MSADPKNEVWILAHKVREKSLAYRYAFAHNRRVVRTLLYALLIVACTALSAYALAYFSLPSQGYLTEKFRAAPFSARCHFYGAALALFVGPWQFHRGLRSRLPAIHRRLGWIYFLAIALSGPASLYMATRAHAGLVAQLGFSGLAVAWMGTSAFGLRSAWQRNFVEHERWMVQSFALTCSALTLRMYIPLATAGLKLSFDAAYAAIAWLCWLPNWALALGLIARQKSARRPSN